MRKIGFTCGAWDLLHPGHLHFLRECKKHCNIFVVGLQVDPSVDREGKNKPVQTTFERFYQLNTLGFISKIIPYETEQDLSNLFKLIKFDERYIGEDHKGYNYTDADNTDYKHVFIPRKHTFSSSELRARILSAEKKSSISGS